MKKEKISDAVIRRMPRYYRHVIELIQSGADRISSGALSNRLGLTASQIRQDFSCFGEFGQQGYGYNLEHLRSEIADILGANNNHTAILVGTGNLGRALMRNFDFEQCGFKLTAAFDIMPELIGSEIRGVNVLPASTISEYVIKHKTDVAVLAVQKQYAPSDAKRLVDSGIRGIWNFTNIDLHIENPNVFVEDIHFADSLLTLSYHISRGKEQ